MISELKLLNYKEKIYKVFIKDKILYISYNEEIKEISKNILGYCLEYFEESLWISFYDRNNSIYMVEIAINNNEKIKINKHLALNVDKYVTNIDSLTILVKNKNQMNLIFRGFDNDNNRGFIFNSNISISNSLNIISDNSLKSYNKPFVTYSYDDKAFLLMCEQGEGEEYIYYDLVDESIVNSFSLPNASNISLVKYREKPIIFYNKATTNDICIKYRKLDINEKNKIIENEKEIDILNKIKELNNIIEEKDKLIYKLLNKV